MARYGWAVHLLKVSLLLACLPASASAVTITFSALSDSATELTVAVTGEANLSQTFWPAGDKYFGNIEDFITNGSGLDAIWFTPSSGITASGHAVTRIQLNDGGGSNDDDLWIWFAIFTSTPGSYEISGSATIDLGGEGHAFGDLT